MDRYRRSKTIPRFPLLVVVVCIVSSITACTTTRILKQKPLQSKNNNATGQNALPGKPDDLTIESMTVIARTHSEESSAGANVLAAALDMIEEKSIVVGSCWDYVNKVYDNAGFTLEKRLTIYRDAENGPYTDPTLIKPGDWIMFKNLTFGNVGHSAIFVDWIDFDRRSAITIEYAGQKREIPGRYREYDVTKCFGILRGKE